MILVESMYVAFGAAVGWYGFLGLVALWVMFFCVVGMLCYAYVNPILGIVLIVIGLLPALPFFLDALPFLIVLIVDSMSDS